eukprot:CAMPEP_0197843060 /NCGR_PEP_ID=MMETSP1437-20131217/47103_1 /TAXON_ID=49252 ORGANISM="Eucampia antarctica, Strain CCMP1452" /NCGR_SAMPLE_ID=MMETSP1437 /ASSEMBLY_ACC=CAM_ASM_001096 /LENGTH=207 /DNA_ID=CAMNT_0043453041 /DNA_START=477 /DNA_END=1100 /DNA_ORIENTATION=-
MDSVSINGTTSPGDASNKSSFSSTNPMFLNKNKLKQMRPHRTTKSKGPSIVTSEALFNEGNEELMPKMIFSNVIIKEPHHPLFKRVWIGQHILNEHSPLLKDKIKSKIKRNNGNWPDSIYNVSGIKHSLEFNDIIVSITGVSNVSGSDVYAHNIYGFNDVVLGFEFVDILLYENDKPKVDMNALHCVVEQFGGGCQNLDSMCNTSSH